VVGEGPIDLVFVPGFVSHLDLQWADPRIARFLEKLASFSRLIRQARHGSLRSGTVKDLVVGSGISFSERGTQQLKGVPGEWRLFSVDR
jgi:hypothetical protein